MLVEPGLIGFWSSLDSSGSEGSRLASGFEPPDLDKPGRQPHQQGLCEARLGYQDSTCKTGHPLELRGGTPEEGSGAEAPFLRPKGLRKLRFSIGPPARRPGLFKSCLPSPDGQHFFVAFRNR